MMEPGDISPDARSVSAAASLTTAGSDRAQAEERRTGIGLCLSGGGFRAALFHLGAVRRLNELGVLSQITTFSSVSGGSIFAAHLASQLRPWPEPGTVFPDWEQQVAQPFRGFTARNLRTGPLLKRVLWPWNWLRISTAVEALAARYETDLTGLRLPELPQRPVFLFCATDMAFGVNWVFSQERIGDYQAGYLSPAPDWPVARAVAASSCFPPVFDPLAAGLRPEQLAGGDAQGRPNRNTLVAGLRLTDGGTYDNMGLEPVWKNHQYVLASDGGSPFGFEPDRGSVWALTSRWIRYLAIATNQQRAVRKRWLIDSYKQQAFQGTYWGIDTHIANYGLADARGYDPDLVDRWIAPIRTDMDAFTKGERAVLENHGYLLADTAIRRHAPSLAATLPPLQVPHPAWMDPVRVRGALADSARICLLGRW